MMHEVDQALSIAGADADVRVVVIAADGPDFCAGHDTQLMAAVNQAASGSATDASVPDPSQVADLDSVIKLATDRLELCLRWRDFAKPTIVQVQGRVIAGGLSVVWPFDIVVAAENARFSDPVVAFGFNGQDYFTHAWELGARKAKELLFTGQWLTARDAYELGMVNHVCPEPELEVFTLSLASTIAQRSVFALSMAKQSVNRALDAQGQIEAIHAALAIHQLCYARNMHTYGTIAEPGSIEQWRAKTTSARSTRTRRATD
jgi:enoyl-CoA hydratase